jgi:hypothetical protein
MINPVVSGIHIPDCMLMMRDSQTTDVAPTSSAVNGRCIQADTYGQSRRRTADAVSMVATQKTLFAALAILYMGGERRAA